MTDTIDRPTAPSVGPSDSPGRRTGAGRLGRPADLQRGREPRADRDGHPRLAAGRDRPRRRRRLARRHGRPRRLASPRPTRGSASVTGPRSRVSGGPTSMGSASPSPAARARVVQMDADFSHDPAVAAEPRRADRRRRRGPRHRLALYQGRVGRGLGHRPPGHLARRQPVRPRRPRSRPERPDRWLQGVARDDPRGRPVRRGPRRRLRLPDRDDIPRQPRRERASARSRSPSATAGSASPR